MCPQGNRQAIQVRLTSLLTGLRFIAKEAQIVIEHWRVRTDVAGRDSKRKPAPQIGTMLVRINPASLQKHMKTLTLSVSVLALFVVGTIGGCSRQSPWEVGTSANPPDVPTRIRTSLNQAGYKDVSVSQDQNSGVVTLSGQVAADDDKSQVESIAKNLAGAQVVSDQVAVLPPDDGFSVGSALDRGIVKNLDAALYQNGMHESVHYIVRNGVVTLSGQLNSQTKCLEAEKVASAVPQVKNVVINLSCTKI
jgi:hyperosmotically inducible periplasmic protein